MDIKTELAITNHKLVKEELDTILLQYGLLENIKDNIEKNKLSDEILEFSINSGITSIVDESVVSAIEAYNNKIIDKAELEKILLNGLGDVISSKFNIIMDKIKKKWNMFKTAFSADTIEQTKARINYIKKDIRNPNITVNEEKWKKVTADLVVSKKAYLFALDVIHNNKDLNFPWDDKDVVIEEGIDTKKVDKWIKDISKFDLDYSYITQYSEVMWEKATKQSIWDAGYNDKKFMVKMIDEAEKLYEKPKKYLKQWDEMVTRLDTVYEKKVWNYDPNVSDAERQKIFDNICFIYDLYSAQRHLRIFPFIYIFNTTVSILNAYHDCIVKY